MHDAADIVVAAAKTFKSLLFVFGQAGTQCSMHAAMGHGKVVFLLWHNRTLALPMSGCETTIDAAERVLMRRALAA